MEVIRLPGYTEDEKLNIAERYLVPKQIEAQRPQGGRARDQRDARFATSMRYYTREAGVRNLEREIAKICRKVVKDAAAQDADARPASR